MPYRKLISALVFALFGICFSRAATAQDCNNPDFCFDFGIPVTVDNFTGSSVSCVLDPGGAGDPFNQLNIGAGLGTATGTFHQTGTATCKRVPNKGKPIPLGACTFELTWTGVSLSSCDPESNSFNASLLCQNIGGGGGPTVTGKITPTVTGKITCPDSKQVVKLGIAGITGIRSDTCTDVFPAINGFQKGQVLDFTVITKGAHQCTGPFVAISNVRERYCNGGFNSGPVDCTPIEGPEIDGEGDNHDVVAALSRLDKRFLGRQEERNGGKEDEVRTRTTNPLTTVLPSVVPFDFKCRPNDRGNANIDILGSASFDVADIIVSSLRCEGVPLHDCVTKDVNYDRFPDLACKIDTCPTFGPELGQLPKNPHGTVTAICTGLLKSGQGIQGLQEVRVTP
jgi:hypothetical protein